MTNTKYVDIRYYQVFYGIDLTLKKPAFRYIPYKWKMLFHFVRNNFYPPPRRLRKPIAFCVANGPRAAGAVRLLSTGRALAA